MQACNESGIMLCLVGQRGQPGQTLPGRGVTRLQLAGGPVESFAPARSAMLKDAQVFVADPTATGKCPDLRLLRARAAENRMFVVAAGTDRAVIIAPNGAIMAESLEGRSMIVVARLVPDAAADKQMAPGTDVVLGRRPELYERSLKR